MLQYVWGNFITHERLPGDYPWPGEGWVGVRRVSNVCGHIYTLVRLPGLYPCWEWVGVRRVCDVCGHMYTHVRLPGLYCTPHGWWVGVRRVCNVCGHIYTHVRLLGLYPWWEVGVSGCKESVQCVWAYLHPCETDRLIPLMGGEWAGVRRVCNVCGYIYTHVRLPGLYPWWGEEWV